MRKFGFSLLLLLLSLLGYSQNNVNDYTAIKNLIDDYKVSINNADTILGANVWADLPEVSFIHPRGHELGWQGVKDNFYGMFRKMFKTRDLKSDNEKITVYNDVAWVEFYWVYDASFADGKTMQSKGRETQVLKKTNNKWRIVNVHYSGMPMTGERQGF